MLTKPVIGFAHNAVEITSAPHNVEILTNRAFSHLLYLLVKT